MTGRSRHQPVLSDEEFRARFAATMQRHATETNTPLLGAVHVAATPVDVTMAVAAHLDHLASKRSELANRMYRDGKTTKARMHWGFASDLKSEAANLRSGCSSVEPVRRADGVS